MITATVAQWAIEYTYPKEYGNGKVYACNDTVHVLAMGFADAVATFLEYRGTEESTIVVCRKITRDRVVAISDTVAAELLAAR